MNVDIVVLVTILVTMLLFLLLSEAVKVDTQHPDGNWALRTCKLPSHLLGQLSLLQIQLVPHSFGFRDGHVPFHHDLQQLSDFCLEKMFKYTMVKSLTLNHLYRVNGFYASQPSLALVVPSYILSLVVIVISSSVTVVHEGKQTRVAAGMLAFTPIRRHEAPVLLQGIDFFYGYVCQISTLNYYCSK